jgi:hypothetical protein
MTGTGSWKAAERFIAAALGGTRVPITGRQRGSAPDIDHPTLAIEVKRRSSLNAFPKWLTTAFEQAEASAAEIQRKTAELKTPIVVIEHAHGAGRPRDHYVMLRLNDFVELTKEGE